MITDLEHQIVVALQTVFDRFGWLGVAGMLAFENATSITPSEVILGLAGWMLLAAHNAPPAMIFVGGLYAALGSTAGAARVVREIDMNERKWDRAEYETALATALRTLWVQQHGSAPKQVRVLVGPDSVAAWIEGVLSPAEQQAARRAEGHDLMQRYAGRLLAAIQPDLRSQVQTITGRRIVSDNVRADVDTGHVLCFFVLGEQLALSALCAEGPSGEGPRV